MKRKFEKHGTVCADFSCLDPKNFDSVAKSFPENTLAEIHSMIAPFAPNELTLQILQLELKDFSSKWNSLKKNIVTFYKEHNEKFDKFKNEFEFGNEKVDACDLETKIGEKWWTVC